MRKVFIFVTLLLGLLVFCACDVEEMSSLSEFSRPYSGVYTCEKLSLGGEDMLGHFDRLELELEYGGSFKLSYETAAGLKGEYTGEYSVSPEGDKIELKLRRGRSDAKRTFVFEDGKVCIDTSLGGRLLHAEFSLP